MSGNKRPFLSVERGELWGAQGRMLIPAFFRLNNNLEEQDESKMAKLVDEKELFKGI